MDADSHLLPVHFVTGAEVIYPPGRGERGGEFRYNPRGEGKRGEFRYTPVEKGKGGEKFRGRSEP